MSKPKWIYLFVLLAGVMILPGCSASKKTAVNESKVKVALPRFFAPNFKKALYKADMKIYGRELSGLMLFKKSNGVVRVAFISEIGLKYFNLEIPAGDTAAIKFYYLIDMINRKPVIKMLETSFRILFLHYPDSEKNYSFECHDGWMVSVLKNGGEKVNYSYQQNSGWVDSARQYGWFKPKIRVEASDYGVQYPSKIQVRLKKKMEINLVLIND
ncbi:MAG: hypothetical protein GXO86_00175 [Chlorobi bacterium]|nr:hypothetical protein [Chlorobiota bacterium]